MDNLQLDILRCSLKDQFYKNKQVDELKSILVHLKTYLNVANFLPELELFSNILYYSLTNLLNHQTIGQECYNMIVYNSKLNRPPSVINRFLWILLKSLVPYLIARSIHFKSQNRMLFFYILRLFWFCARELNKLVFFYTQNSFFDLEDRFTSIKYLSLKQKPNKNVNSTEKKSFNYLAFVKMITVCIEFYFHIRNLLKFKQNAGKSSTSQAKDTTTTSSETTSSISIHASSSKKCSICLEQVKQASVTPCGHLFCWMCIHQHIENAQHFSSSASNALCPSCREPIESNRIIFLNNF
jgi:peroxin-10